MKIGFEAVVEIHNGLNRGELTFMMSSLFGGLNCAVGETDRGGRVRKGEGEARGRVQSTMHPEMKWIIECGINTANNLGSPPLTKKEEKK